MLRGLTSDATAVQSPQFFDIPNGRERPCAEALPRGRSRADDEPLPPEIAALRSRVLEKTETARRMNIHPLSDKTLRKYNLRACKSAALLKQP